MASGLANRAYYSNRSCPNCDRVLDIIKSCEAGCSHCGAVLEPTGRCVVVGEGKAGLVQQPMIMAVPGQMPVAVLLNWQI